MKTIGNVLWLVFAGIWLALEWLLVALVLTILIVTIPMARQCVKLARFSLWPMGRVVLPSPKARRLGAVGQVIWVVVAGWWIALSYLFSGVVLCLTIIGIPFGLQSFKLAGLAFAPFGKEIRLKSDVRAALALRTAAPTPSVPPVPSGPPAGSPLPPPAPSA
jgi:uncharacterized membrane protein YccF (DUF307 family)